MGYLTQEHIASSKVFQRKIQMALISKVDTILKGQNAKHIAMAKVVMQDTAKFAEDLARLLALGNLDLDSVDGQIDAAIVQNLDWLVARTGK